MKRIVMLLLVIVLSGCTTTWKKSDSKEFIDKSSNFAAYLPEGWMYFPAPKNFGMTKDGIFLDNIFVDMIKFNKELSSTKKRFQSNMLVDELAEVDIDNYRSNGQVTHFEVLDNQVVTLDGKDTYRFVFRYQTPQGLKSKGIVYGTVHNDMLYRIVYIAAEQHYFALYEKVFESFIQSFRFLQCRKV